MSVIEITLFVAAGFLGATLIALLTLPFMTSQAAKKAVRKLRANMPFSAAEMAAEKDQLRAEHAISLRKVEINLAKQSESVASQNIEIRGIREKLAGASKIGKASKLALEEMRAKEHDLNERLRVRDAQFAGLEQRSRQMLRDNRELKLALRKQGVDLKTLSTDNDTPDIANARNATAPGLPVADAALSKHTDTASLDQLKNALDIERTKFRQAETQISDLREKLSTARSTDKTVRPTHRLPTAKVPVGLGGEDTFEPSAIEQQSIEKLYEPYTDIRDHMLHLAANLTAVTAKLEGTGSPIHKILAESRSGTSKSLASIMKQVIETTTTKKAAPVMKPPFKKPDQTQKTTPEKPSTIMAQKSSPDIAKTLPTADPATTKQPQQPTTKLAQKSDNKAEDAQKQKTGNLEQPAKANSLKLPVADPSLAYMVKSPAEKSPAVMVPPVVSVTPPPKRKPAQKTTREKAKPAPRKQRTSNPEKA